MPITHVSFTGWDNTVEPIDVITFLQEHPKAIAGIHFSEERRGEHRHPRWDWVDFLTRLAKSRKKQSVLHLDAHLGNRWSLDLISGKTDVLEKVINLEVFDRVQLNHVNLAAAEKFLPVLEQFPRTTFIIPNHHLHEEFCKELSQKAETKGLKNLAFLFDASWGRGETPSTWPEVHASIPCGYAGGLGPQNIAKEAAKLKELNPTADFWLDMESKLRDKASDTFRIDYCTKCLDMLGF